MEGPWVNRIVVDWKAVFPPVSGPEGYEPTQEELCKGLIYEPEKGGWARDKIPSLLLICNLGDDSQHRTLKLLEGDARFRDASRLFNCFRVDARGIEKHSRELSLGVYLADGTLVGTAGGDRLNKVLPFMETAYRVHTARELTKMLPAIHSNLVQLAYLEHEIDSLCSKLVCPDCGETHAAVPKSLAVMRQHVEKYRQAVDSFRRRA
jgi:hypothetical protein